ncbi:ORF3 protein [Simian hemorrhagic encephalitis virus]|uniref:ORF3 protein n=1 Tax=Simian hemorrhagic encephalitis virus TaxID=1965068 RepID=A0A0F6PU79_9NIDO|nr:ORF3 protein [Simian hemorrhagic encephalitis virus]AKC89295.1 ORF3 protein [Simian hemorrhagic encephalitis virus]
MGPLYLGVVSALCLVAVGSQHRICMICTSHNITQFHTGYHQTPPPKRQGASGYTPPDFAQVLGYGETCSDNQILGHILSAQEETTGTLKGLDDAFTLLSFARCLVRALEYHQQNISHRFFMANNTLQLCANLTLAVDHLTISTPWFISPGAIRWATIICSIVAVLRALYG